MSLLDPLPSEPTPHATRVREPALTRVREREPTLAHTIVALRDRHDRGPIFLGEADAVRQISFAALVGAVEDHARALAAAGTRQGERVGVIVPDPESFLVAFLGLARLGAVPVPLADAATIRDPARWVVHCAQILRAAGATRLILGRERGEAGPHLAALCPGLVVHVLEDMSQKTGPDLPDPDSFAADEPAFLQFTSGSTGRPRGVRVSHRAIAANTHAIMVDGLQSGPDDVGVCWLPLHHDMGLIGFVLAPLRYRVPVVFMTPGAFIKQPRRWMEAVHRFRGSITFAPNFAYVLALRRAPGLTGLDLSCLRVLGCGAEPIHAPALHAFLAHHAPAGLRPHAILPCYGLAEATLAVSFVALDEPLHVDRIAAADYHADGHARPARDDEPELRFVSCGRPLPGHEILIVDDAGAPLPERRVGHILVRGPSLGDGYEHDPEASAAAFTPQGLRTGDRGYLANGELHVTGRSKDLVILHGRNYDPQDIERVVAELPGVRDGKVVAFTRPGPDSEALVLALEAHTREPAELAQQIRGHVARSLGLTVAEVVLLPTSALPRTTSGKLQRGLTRELHLRGRLAPKDMSP